MMLKTTATEKQKANQHDVKEFVMFAVSEDGLIALVRFHEEGKNCSCEKCDNKVRRTPTVVSHFYTYSLMVLL